MEKNVIQKFLPILISLLLISNTKAAEFEITNATGQDCYCHTKVFSDQKTLIEIQLQNFRIRLVFDEARDEDWLNEHADKIPKLYVPKIRGATSPRTRLLTNPSCVDNQTQNLTAYVTCTATGELSLKTPNIHTGLSEFRPVTKITRESYCNAVAVKLNTPIEVKQVNLRFCGMDREDEPIIKFFINGRTIDHLIASETKKKYLSLQEYIKSMG
jgi:hypothetical protein